MDLLIRIKRCALANRIRLTDKARDEMDLDFLDIPDIRESLMNAVAIYKTIRSKNPRTGSREYLHIIQSPNLSGVMVCGRWLGRLLSAGLQQTRLMTQLIVKTCPTCGSKRIRRVKRDIKSTRGGEPYVAHHIEIEECPNCGERLFSPEALDQIAARRPQTGKRTHTRKSA